jgi:hypothetical protein
MIPPWALAAIGSLLGVVLKLVNAATDAEREEALMLAAEEIKRALDARKFGG